MSIKTMEGWMDGKLLDRPVRKKYNILSIVEDFLTVTLVVFYQSVYDENVGK